MVGERMVPMLPCADIDSIRDFHLPMGFKVTYRQLRPNPYLALQREGIDLHYFGMDDLKPEDSYSTCGIAVTDTQLLFDVFAEGLRLQFGKLPMSGIPRITRPRKRKNAGNFPGFSLIDPAGNWIRVMTDQAGQPAPSEPTSKLARAVADAVVFADSKGDVEQGLKILERAIRLAAPDEDPVIVSEAEAFLAELTERSAG